MKKLISIILASAILLLMCPMGMFASAAEPVLLRSAEFTAADTVVLNASSARSFAVGDLTVSASQDYGAYTAVTGWTVSGSTLTFAGAFPAGTTLRIEGCGGVAGSVTATCGDRQFPAVVYSGDDIVKYTGDVTESGAVRFLNAAESSLEFVFAGSGITLYGPVGSGLGMADVYLDGILAGETDSYAAASADEAALFVSGTLAFGLHRVTLMKNRKTNEAVTDNAAPVGFTRAAIVTDRADAGKTLSLNGQWSITKGEPTATALATESGYDFSAADPILVPGNIWEAYPGYTGTVWYGKVFHDYLESHAGDRAYLRFEAVQYSCDVYLNGVLLGSHTGSEIPFEFDVTDALKMGQDNFLAVAVTNCKGMLLAGSGTGTAAFWDCGGIWQEVSLNVRPAAYVSDVYVLPDWQTGDVDLQVTVINMAEQSVPVTLDAAIAEKATGTTVETVAGSSFTAAPGKNVFTVSGTVENYQLWDTEHPNLYTADVSLNSACGAYAYKTVRFGFRHIEMRNGYFYLNGKRFILKMTHQNVYDPVIIQATPRDITYQIKTIDQLKAGGFNAFRTIGMAGLPAQLDYADEQGLLVYEESSQSWLGKNAWVNEDYDALVLRDRNHPSIVIWGLLNETGYSGDNRLDVTRAYLTRLRALDMTRLVLWTSGSWDSNSQLPHISNSGSATWDVYLGGEDPNKVAGGYYSSGSTSGWVGDLHYYPTYPTSQNILEQFRTMGAADKPFFISEAGTGSLFNPYNEQRKAIADGGDPDSFARTTWVDPFIQSFNAFFAKYSGLSGMYDTAEDIIIASDAVNCRQREILMTYLRANPKLNGYGLTSLSDAQGLGEGVMDNFRDYKVGHETMLSNAWAGLRWCMLFNNDNSNIRVGTTQNFKVYLANEDVLPAGSYTAQFTVKNAAGTVVYSSGNVPFTVSAGENAPLAFSVWDQNVPISFPEGTYTLNASLNSDEYTPASDSTTFYVTDNSSVVDADSKTVTVVGTLSAAATNALPAGYKLVWQDEFTGGTLNSDNWNFYSLMRARDDLELRSDSTAVEMTDGSVILKSDYDEDKDVFTANMSLTTKNALSFKYGYIEMRAKLPFGAPAFPSFWMQSTKFESSTMGEIDILEHFADYDPFIQTGIHKWYAAGGHSVNSARGKIAQYHFDDFEEAGDWHTYAMLWTPSELKFYVDGECYHTIDITDETGNFNEDGYESDDMSCFRDYAYVIFNNYLYTPCSADDPDKAALASDFEGGPITYEIDYVRLYQSADIGGIVRK